MVRGFFFARMDHTLLITEAIRHLEEGRKRIHRCAGLLGEEGLWHRPNAQVVSPGNLVLHLCGNVGQWIISTLGKRPDHRQRQQEFDEPGPIPTPELLAKLDGTISEAVAVLENLNAADLEAIWDVQIYKETGVAIVVHVVEHFSYHVGQITLHTKLFQGVDTGYYSGQDL